VPPDTARYGRGRSRRDKVFGSGSESAHFGQLLFLASPITLIRGDRRTGICRGGVPMRRGRLAIGVRPPEFGRKLVELSTPAAYRGGESISPSRLTLNPSACRADCSGRSRSFGRRPHLSVNDGRLTLKLVRVETSNEIQYSWIGQLLFAQLFPSRRKREFDATAGQPIKFALPRGMGE
jgi:hypothetical protein